MRIILQILAILTLSIVGILGYHGAFSPVVISKESMGPTRFVYQPVASHDYREAARLTSAMDMMLESLEIRQRTALELIFPDGSAQIGFRVSDVELKLALSNGTRVRTIPAGEYLVSRFPDRSRLSIIVGDLKVNAAFNAYLNAQGLLTNDEIVLREETEIVYLRAVENK